ncbi:MAG: O-antigen ligase family protein, partial [Candidatus Uhrbacteria bacterium]|nr:O-antigen ligase family protein [Candidatus Uhrbacteria bacterium]
MCIRDREWGVILNEENRGFAKACNQGMVGYDARYVLLLNPDTECSPGSLTAFVKEADTHPKAGICGPKILNEDGSVQLSVRRFPDIWSQLVVLLKLTHVSKWFSRFLRKYHAEDLDVNHTQDVDQVMGACFLIRRELIEKIGGLDEAYEIWFEEVDYCKQAYAHGYTVMYLPRIHVKHIRGASFAKADVMRKQRIFTASMQTYFQKWHPVWQAKLIETCRSFALWLTKTILARRGIVSAEVSSRHSNLPPTTYHLPLWLLLILSLELVSALTIFHWAWNSIALIVVAGVFAWVAYKRPALALSAFLLELTIGSKGALLQLGGWPGVLSLRVVLFVALFLGWGLNVLVHHRVPQVIRLLASRKAWMFLVAMAGYGALRGLAFHHEQAGADANAWVFLALLAPVLDVADRYGKDLKRYAFGAFIAGIVWLGVKTIGLEYLFSHGFKSISPQAYLWVRRTGVGEVTLVTANAFRIFMQSYIWLIPALFGVVSYAISHQKDSHLHKTKTHRLFFLAIILATLGISLSRSIWIGCAVGGLLLIALYRARFFQAWKSLIGFVVSGIAAFVIIFVTLAFPIPHVDMASMKTLFGSRASTSDAAAASRWNLLPPVMEKIKQHPILGNGFGATITYESKDPRILQEHPDGMYTTYAFEWGWLEHWVKMGIFGFLAVIIVLFSLVRRVATSQLPEWTRYAALATIAALAAVHVFTPYLNHPLGLGMLFMIEGMLVMNQKERIS